MTVGRFSDRARAELGTALAAMTGPVRPDTALGVVGARRDDYHGLGRLLALLAGPPRFPDYPNRGAAEQVLREHHDPVRQLHGGLAGATII